MDLWAPIAAVLVLALLVESMIEYFTDGLPIPAWAKKAGAAGVGVALALIYQIDVFAFLLNAAPLWPPIGPVLTGLVLGRGANYVHDFAARVTTPESRDPSPRSPVIGPESGGHSPTPKAQPREYRALGGESWAPSPRARVAHPEIRPANSGSRLAGSEPHVRGARETQDSGLGVRDS